MMDGREFGAKFEPGAKRAVLAWRLRASKDGGGEGTGIQRSLRPTAEIHAFPTTLRSMMRSPHTVAVFRSYASFRFHAAALGAG